MAETYNKPADLIDQIRVETDRGDGRSTDQIAREMNLPPAQIARAVRRRLRRYGLTGPAGIRKEVAVLETKLWRARQRMTQGNPSAGRTEDDQVREILRLQDDLGELQLLARLGRIAGDASQAYSLPFAGAGL